MKVLREKADSDYVACMLTPRIAERKCFRRGKPGKPGNRVKGEGVKGKGALWLVALGRFRNRPAFV